MSTKSSIPSSVKVKARLSHPILHAGKPAQIFLRIDATGLGETGKRPPLDLAVVLDRSGSMTGAKIAYAKKAVDLLIDRLLPSDHMALVAYDDVVETVFARRKVDDALVMKTRAAAVESRGCTNLSGGLVEGLQQLGRESGALRRVLLLSDGLANAGVTDPAGLGDIAQQGVAGGKGVSTFGVGLDFDERLLRHIADTGGGNYYYIASPDEIPGIFMEELGELGDVVAQNLTIDFRPKGAEVLGVLGFDGAGLPAQAGAVRAGAVRSVMLALSVSAADGAAGLSQDAGSTSQDAGMQARHGAHAAAHRPGDGEVVLGEVICRWTTLDDAITPREKRITVSAVTTCDLKRVQDAVDEDVLRAARLQLAADENLAATRAAQAGDERGYRTHLASARQAIEALDDPDAPDVRGLRLLQEELSARAASDAGADIHLQKRVHRSQYDQSRGRPTREE